MNEITELSEIEKARKNSPSSFIKVLVSQRTQNDSTGLPEIPSAQLWNSMTDTEKEEFQKAVEATKTKWEDYKKTMLQHHPQPRGINTKSHLRAR